MARIANSSHLEWTNYHRIFKSTLTRHMSLEGDAGPAVTSSDYFRALGDEMKALVHRALDADANICAVGGGWSFSDIVRPSDWFLHTMSRSPNMDKKAWPGGRVGAGRVFSVSVAQLNPAFPAANAHQLILAGGGVRIGELNVVLEKRNLSLKTSGASNGQSIAGAIATGTHGSVVEHGSIQDHVRGLLLVTGPDRCVWIEQASAPMLDDAFILTFADHIERDDEMFEGAAVHLGALGYVAAVLLEVADHYMLDVRQFKALVGRGGITDLQNGDFHAYAKRFGFDREPYFVQTILNPFHPFDFRDPIEGDPLRPSFFGMPALHRFFFLADPDKPPAPPGKAEDIVGDPINLVTAALNAAPVLKVPGLDKEANRAALLAMMYNLNLYPRVPQSDNEPVFMRWGQTTPPPRNEGDLFSASFAFQRSDLIRALRIILPVFRQGAAGTFVCTLRFVEKSAGLLALTSHDHNVVIDCDGLPTQASRDAFQRIRTALLSQADLPFREHMGKLAPIDQDRMVHDFGSPATPGTAAHRWRAVRDRLMPDPRVRKVFGSQALRNAGLI